jgi:diadenosine tetraphosphate (Ap4A) HIT family hydrolase
MKKDMIKPAGYNYYLNFDDDKRQHITHVHTHPRNDEGAHANYHS